MPTGLGGAILPGLQRRPTDNSVLSCVDGAWVGVTALTMPGVVGTKPVGVAGINLDGNGALGDFTLSISPATLTAARRWSFPDRSDTVAGLGTQTFTGIQTFTTAIAAASGGTGVSNTGTLTNATNTTITGGGTLALGGFTLTAPASGTAALLAAGLNNGRIAVSNSANAINDYAELSWNNGIGSLVVGSNAYSGNPGVLVNAAAGTIRNFQFQTAGVIRWFLAAGAAAEGGANSGTPFVISAYSDAGGFIDDVLSITRVAGGTVTWSRPLKTIDTTASTSTTTGALVVAGGVGFGGAINAGGTIFAPAATTSISSIRLPHGAAPSSPVNGDMWTTTAGLFVRINGASVGPLT